MKYCGKCKQTKDEQDFSYRDKSIGKRNAWCRLCVSGHEKKWWRESSDRRSKVAKRAQTQKEINRIFACEYLSSRGCADCGEKDPIVLEFDHLRDKHDGISKLIQRGVSLETIKSEIAKCDVVCANCHRHRTASRSKHRWIKQRIYSSLA